jgi:transforming growth factor-beta-induced protein
MMNAITIALALFSLVGSASGFAGSSPQAFGRPVTALDMATKKATPAATPPPAKKNATPAKKPVLADIVDTAVAAGSFKTLAAALGAADLVATLKGKGPFTVFAPTDEAFAKLPKGTVEDLLKPENKAKLAAILTYHVVAGEVMASTVVTMDGKTAATVNGASVKIGVKGGKVTVDGANVVTTDIKTSNGVIHVIDSVMIPK